MPMPEHRSTGTSVPAVLQVLPCLEPDEAGRSTLDLARYLRRRGGRVFVASAGGRLTRELAAAGGTHLEMPLDRTGWLALWGNAGRLARAMRRYRIDVIHARAPGPAWSAAVASRRTGAAFVTTCHQLPDPASFERALLRGQRVIAVSDFLAEGLASHCRMERDKVRVVRVGIDMAEFDPERVRGHRLANLAERCNLPMGKPLLVAPGGLVPGRGHLLLLEAAAKLERRDFMILFASSGESDGGYARKVLAKLRSTRLEDRVRFAGDLDDLPAALALGDAVVLPAVRPDPSGALAAAAQAMGKPVIVTDQGALAESVLPAATGWLVPPDDPGELARAVDLALTPEDSVRQRLAARARGFVIDTFGMDAMGARTFDLYRELRHPNAAESTAPAVSMAEAG